MRRKLINMSREELLEIIGELGLAIKEAAESDHPHLDLEMILGKLRCDIYQGRDQ